MTYVGRVPDVTKTCRRGRFRGGPTLAVPRAAEPARWRLESLEALAKEIVPRVSPLAPPRKPDGAGPGPRLRQQLRRGLLGRGGIVDRDRAAEIVLRELQKGQIGRISLEGPDVRGIDDEDEEDDQPEEDATGADAIESSTPESKPSGDAT